MLIVTSAGTPFNMIRSIPWFDTPSSNGYQAVSYRIIPQTLHYRKHLSTQLEGGAFSQKGPFVLCEGLTSVIIRLAVLVSANSSVQHFEVPLVGSIYRP